MQCVHWNLCRPVVNVKKREARDAAAQAATDAQVEADRKTSRQTALENVLRVESERPPLTIEEYQVTFISGLAPAIDLHL